MNFKNDKGVLFFVCLVLFCIYFLSGPIYSLNPHVSEKNKQLLERGHLLFDEGRYREALLNYKRYAENNPWNLQVHIFIGECYKAEGKYDSAMSEYKNILDLEAELDVKEKSQLYAAVGDLYLKKKDSKTAGDYFEKALKNNPDARLAYNMGQAFFSDNYTRGAEYFFKRAAEIKPGWGEPYLKLGYTYLNSGDTSSALRYFNRYLELAPDSSKKVEIGELIKKLSKTLD